MELGFAPIYFLAVYCVPLAKWQSTFEVTVFSLAEWLHICISIGSWSECTEVAIIIIHNMN